MNNCKLLIIDDDEDDVSLLTDAFIKIGVDSVYYVFTAMMAFIYLEGVEASCLPKLIVTDLHLPGMSGAEFLKGLKGMDKYKHIAVVVLSSSKTPEEIENYKLMGALEYLVKPNTYQEYVDIAAELKRKMDLN